MKEELFLDRRLARCFRGGDASGRSLVRKDGGRHVRTGIAGVTLLITVGYYLL